MSSAKLKPLRARARRSGRLGATPGLAPARAPRERRDDARLLLIDTGSLQRRDADLRDLAGVLGEGDLLVVNDAATLPGSLPARTEGGEAVELRLASGDGERWRAVVFGAGDWRTRTEDRPAPPELVSGEELVLDGLRAAVTGVSPCSSRLIDLQFSLAGAELWAALYRLGRPVQYSHLSDGLALWSVQTVYAGKPWAAEMPSAGRPLTWSLLLELRRRGVRLASLTHAAGLSATGDPVLDAALPLPERYAIPSETVDAIQEARRAGGRVLAVGTTVVRALEGSVLEHGRLQAGDGVTDLRLDAGSKLRVVDGLLTGIHDPSESHYRLLQAFAPEATLRDAWEHARASGYLGHEFGDLSLLAPGVV